MLPGQGQYWKPIFNGPDGVKETIEGYATDIITEKSLDVAQGARQVQAVPAADASQGAASPVGCRRTRYYRWLADVKVPEPPTLFDDYSNRTSSARSQKMEIGRDMTLASDLKVLPPGKAPGRLTPAQAAAWQAAFRRATPRFRKPSSKAATSRAGNTRNT